MGDTYRPGGGGGDGRGRYDHNRDRSQNHHNQQDRSYRPHYDPRPPPPGLPSRYYDSQPFGSYASHNAPRSPPRNPRSDNFTFRGAGGSQSNRPEQDFTFNAPGPKAPNGFAPDGPRNAHERPRRFDREGRPPRHENSKRGRGRGRGDFRGRGNFRGPVAARDRDILSKMGGDRETTPEQFEGMVDGQARFKDAMDSADSSDSDDAPRKRTKIEASSAPKWSNPDPYTSLPPPETLGAPKKDIVQQIRKAKNDAAGKGDGEDKVAKNDDFISFNFDDDGSEDLNMETDSPPTQSPAQSGAPTFSHRDLFHRKTSTAAAAPEAASPSAFTSINQRAQPPQYEDSGLSIVPERVSRPPKRKGRDNRPLYGDVTAEWQVVNGKPMAPWCAVDHSQTASVGLRLHKEICDFYEYIKPRPYEEAARRDLILRVQKAVQAFGGQNSPEKTAEVHCFGSFASGLYLPTADMDLVVISQSYKNGGPRQIGTSANQLRKFVAHFNNIGTAKPNTCSCIPRSKVPIVKFTDKRTGIKVDISFENNSGFPAIETFKAWKEKYPALPVLIALVKQFLVMRGMNEVFSGGIGGFTTICLVTHILQIKPELLSESMNETQHYGELFMTFLDFYGNKLDIRNCGILMAPPYHYDKEKHPRASQNKERLTIIDPNNGDNDISGGSHKIDAVLSNFRSAYNELLHHMDQISRGAVTANSVLECIIGGNYTSVDSQRELLDRQWGNVDPSKVASGRNNAPNKNKKPQGPPPGPKRPAPPANRGQSNAVSPTMDDPSIEPTPKISNAKMTKTERKDETTGMTKKQRKKLNRKESREANERNAKQAQQSRQALPAQQAQQAPHVQQAPQPSSGLRRSARNKPPTAPSDTTDPKPVLQDPNNASNKAKLAHRRAKKAWKKRHPKEQKLLSQA